MDESQVPFEPKKRGPVKRVSARANIILPPDLLLWAKAQPEGLSGLVRLLLTQERQRRQAASS